MSEQSKPFVVTDRRRHTMDGEVRPDADPSPERPFRTESEPSPLAAAPAASESEGSLQVASSDQDPTYDEALPQAPSEEQKIQARMAYTQTANRLSTAIRAANPGMDHPPPMNFDGLVQSVYMTAIMQLGGATPEGQQPQVDLMGAQQSIAMLTVLSEKTTGNLSAEESALVDRALFELQMAFLEITQALARSAAAKQQQQGAGFPQPQEDAHPLSANANKLPATLTFLGSGTSMGVPTLGCSCAVCTSTDPHNRRTRPSVLIEYTDHAVLIDTGPDFHAQALREHITRLDAVLYTHSHADHILGMDDLRPLTFKNSQQLPLYADDPTATAIERIFDYTFDATNRYPTSARVQLHRLNPAPGAGVELFGACFRRIPVTHGRQEITGYRFGSAAYLTDMSDIPPESISLLQNLDILILDALRRTPHPSHSHLAKSIAFVELLKPRRAFFTHIGHELDHALTEAELPPNIRLAYDSLKLNFEIAE